MSNQKIIINEVDTTTPRGSGVSSDVVYVPGLAVDTFVLDGNTYSTPKNTPVLCTSVAEFEATFGPAPYILQPADVDYIEDHMLGELSDASVSDDTVVSTPSNQVYLDKSYMYAKELINAGLAVLYENIAPENKIIEQGTLINKATTLETVNTTTVRYVACKADKATGDITHDCEIKLNPMYDDNGNLLSSGSVRVSLDTSAFPDTKATVAFALAPKTGSTVFTVRTEESDVDGEEDLVYIDWSNVTTVTAFNETINCTLTTNYSGTKDGVVYPITVHMEDGYEIVPDLDGYASGRVEYMFTNLGSSLIALEDKNGYSVKYITSGGYPVFTGTDVTLANKMTTLAYNRGDCVAIIDHEDNINEIFVGQGSLLQRVNTVSFQHPEFGAMFTPWGVYSLVCNYSTDCHSQQPVNASGKHGPLEVKRGQFVMPASFGYFLCLAAAVKTGPNFIAMAGVSRGVVNGLQKLHTNKNLTNVIAEDFQPKYGATGANTSINAITNIRPYGLTIWGNRTLLPVAPKGSVALNFLNVRNMVSDIKKVAYDTAKVCMFEQDNDTLWLKFKSGVSPLLEQLKSGSGIKDYKIIKLPTKYNGSQLTRGEMSAVIKIFPVYPVEYFEITVVITDDDVSVS